MSVVEQSTLCKEDWTVHETSYAICWIQIVVKWTIEVYCGNRKKDS